MSVTQEFNTNKNYADLRIKLGRKQIPDKYCKTVDQGSSNKKMVFEDEDLPSDIDENQWAEIN